MIYLGSDHAGFELKERIKEWLKEWGRAFEDKGPFVFDGEDDYPDFARAVAKAVSQNSEEHRGIIVGGSGQGEAIVANRFRGVRAAVFYGPRETQEAVDIEGRKSADPYEIIKLSREHNNTNVLSLAARFVSDEEAKTAVRLWFEVPFSAKERHVRRIRKTDEGV